MTQLFKGKEDRKQPVLRGRKPECGLFLQAVCQIEFVFHIDGRF